MSDPKADGIAARKKARADWEVSKRYRPFLHFAATTGGCALVAIWALSHLHDVRWPQLLAIPGALLFANFFEWWVHKNLMHRPRRGLITLFQKHTLMHHKLFHHDDMQMYDWRELDFVLMSAALIGVILVPVVGLGFACGLLLGTNVGWLMVATLVLYVLFYELSHLSYHLPEGHPVRRLPGQERRSRHHARHHNPTVMARSNFNITVPLADLIMGTYDASPDDDCKDEGGNKDAT